NQPVLCISERTSRLVTALSFNSGEFRTLAPPSIVSLTYLREYERIIRLLQIN
ncbi:844_t:CDS:1, partial [Paraglomus brasilianum]